MLYGRRLDESLEHVDGSRYALVHAVAKRARQITLWLTADPTELRAESAPPPSSGDFISRDPVALAENEIIQGEVMVRWDPEGRADERELPDASLLTTDPLLLDSLGDDDDDFDVIDDDTAEVVTPALAQVLSATDADAEDDDEVEDPVDDEIVLPVDEALIDADDEVEDDLIEVPLEEAETDDDDLDGDDD